MKYTKLPTGLDMDQSIEAIEEARMAGFCLACGCEQENIVEPDAVEYKCDDCGERAVFGAEEILMMMGRVLMNANDIHRAMQKLQTEELVDMAENAASEVRRGSADTLALSIQIDMALLVLMDRLPADVFAGICHDCDIDTDAGQAHH